MRSGLLLTIEQPQPGGWGKTKQGHDSQVSKFECMGLQKTISKPYKKVSKAHKTYTAL